MRSLKKQKKFKSICDFFDEQAQKTPHYIALIEATNKLTYYDLNQKANELAHFLLHQGIQPQDVIGLYLTKNIYSIVGLLAIFKAGATYLPLDPSYPIERLQYMVSDARPSVLLTETSLIQKLPILPNCRTVCLDDYRVVSNPSMKSNIDPDSSAYIVYTSGSTGKPKGIVMAHRGLATAIEARSSIYPDTPIALLTGSISFDPTLLTILYVLIAGGTLCIPENESDLQKTVDLINRHHINFILCVTTFYVMLLETATSLPTLQFIFVGGETLPQSLPGLHARVTPQAYLYNEYGPAEHAIGGTIAKIYDPNLKQIFPITIGQPWSYVHIHILDQYLQPTPTGSEGEIYIEGVGLAKGYLHQEALTSQKFLWVKLNGVNPIRLYKTGDRGRQLPNGDIEFLGRMDHQIKIGGYRIELTEIESVLSQDSRVNEAIVLVQERDSNQLVGFYSTDAPSDLQEELFTHLKRFLPQYMIPSLLVRVKKWPRTPNGKIDRTGLLRLLETMFLGKRPLFTPDQVQENLRKIWASVLQKKDFGMNDNFFDLGGKSIQLMQVQTLIQEILHLQLNLIDLFQLPTLSKLTTYLQKKSTYG
jgi:amino acid adenylation domain-containing protein